MERGEREEKVLSRLHYLSGVVMPCSFFMVPGAKDILQIFDHVSIYLLIAGSYTPFMMIAMHHSVEANVLLVMEWTTALTGIVISLATCSVGVINQTTNLLEVMIYLAMGVAILCVWNQLVVSICTAALQLLIGGGVAYIAGEPGKGERRIKPEALYGGVS